jgi:hypothetical protein
VPRATYVLEYADAVERLRAAGARRPLQAAFLDVFGRPFTGADPDWLIRLAAIDELTDRRLATQPRPATPVALAALQPGEDPNVHSDTHPLA